MSLKDRLAAQIAASGPLTVAQYMQACLHDPADGYYATRPAIGEEGDFITAPMVSQMFGEMIGLWAVETWRGLGAPTPFRLVEAGPGDGTLMSDILRAAKLVPEFLAAADVWLVEASQPLMARQKARLAGAAVTWAAQLDDVPASAPLILIANELLDCLPARQFVQSEGGWAEKLVALDEDGGLCFVVSGPPLAGGTVMEVSPAQEAFGAILGERIRRDSGAALLIDYGRDEPGVGDTFQALAAHKKVDPLAEPGAADLTVHADFPAVLAAAKSEGCETRITTQSLFLRRLGIEYRAGALARARPERTETIRRQIHRLVAPEEMGDLFKAAVIHYPAQPAPPGFEDIAP